MSPFVIEQMAAMSIPSPSFSSFNLGPLTIHVYGITMVVSIITAWAIGERRWIKRGGSADTYETVMLVAVIFGIIGARLYVLITEFSDYFGPGADKWEALRIWHGGLGVMGAIPLGALAAWVMTKIKKVSFLAMADCLAPGILLGQAIGRLGNWFNQEVFGLPTNLAWGLEIDLRHRPPGFEQFSTFHPTFLYEMIWNVCGVFVLLWIARRFTLKAGELFAAYVIIYTFGRFWIDMIRIDPSNYIGPLRVHDAIALGLFVLGVVWLLILHKTSSVNVQIADPGNTPDLAKSVAVDDLESCETDVDVEAATDSTGSDRLT